jgi:hypothetical protein
MVKPSAYEQSVPEGFAVAFKEGYEEGRLLEASDTILRIDQRSFGPPDKTTKSKIKSVTDLKRLRHLIDKLPSATGWSDFLADL